MDLIFGWIEGIYSNIGPFILLLGLLIFIHEWGHFAVARFFNVRVEVFSLGFGKKIFKKKKGDTTYCISLIPLGGYVKMFGDNPNEEIAEEDKKHSFVHQPVWPRIAIVAAGPLMNIIFAFFLFMIIPVIGDMQPPAVIGDIKPASQAYESGFRSGDTIQSVNNKEVKSWVAVQEVIESGFNKSHEFKVKREASDELAQFSVTTTSLEALHIMHWDKKVSGIEGLDINSKAPIVGVPNLSSIAYKSGLRNLDIIKSINGVKVSYWRDIERLLKSSPNEFSMEVASYGDEETIRRLKITSWVPEAENLTQQLGIEDTELYLAKIVKGSPAERAGLLQGDKLISIDGAPVKAWKDVLGIVSSFGETGKSKLDFEISRSGESQTLSIEPEMTEHMNKDLREEKRFTIGIISAIAQSRAPHILVTNYNPLQVLSIAIKNTITTTSRVILGFWKLITFDVSPKNISGVLRIGEVAGDFYRAGVSYFLKLMAMISINLFILNLLPIPVLDGGHLFFYAIEAIKGSPVSLKKMEMAQQFGLVILLLLMGFSIFNDFIYFLN